MAPGARPRARDCFISMVNPDLDSLLSRRAPRLIIITFLSEPFRFRDLWVVARLIALGAWAVLPDDDEVAEEAMCAPLPLPPVGGREGSGTRGKGSGAEEVVGDIVSLSLDSVGEVTRRKERLRDSRLGPPAVVEAGGLCLCLSGLVVAVVVVAVVAEVVASLIAVVAWWMVWSFMEVPVSVRGKDEEV